FVYLLSRISEQCVGQWSHAQVTCDHGTILDGRERALIDSHQRPVGENRADNTGWRKTRPIRNIAPKSRASATVRQPLLNREISNIRFIRSAHRRSSTRTGSATIAS